MADVRFQCGVGIRRSTTLEHHHLVLHEDCLLLYRSAEEAEIGDEELLQGRLALEDVTEREVEVQDWCVTLIAGDDRLSLVPSEDGRWELVRALQAWIKENQPGGTEIGEESPEEGEEESQECDGVDFKEDVEGEESDADAEDGMPGIIYSGSLLIQGKANRFFVLTHEAFVGFRTEAEARDEMSYPFMVMPVSMVQSFKTTDRGFVLEFGLDKSVEFQVASSTSYGRWVAAWACIADPEVERHGSIMHHLNEQRDHDSEAAVSKKLVGRHGGARPTVVTNSLFMQSEGDPARRSLASKEAIVAPVKSVSEDGDVTFAEDGDVASRKSVREGVDENAQERSAEATAMFYTAIVEKGAPEPAPSERRRRWVELANDRLSLYDISGSGDRIQLPAYVWEMSDVSGIEIRADAGFFLQVDDGVCVELLGPEGDTFDQWLDEFERALTGRFSERLKLDAEQAETNSILDDVMPFVVLPLMAGMLEVTLPGESQPALRQVVMQRDILKIFAAKHDDEQAVAKVPLAEVDRLQVLSNQFLLGTQDRAEYMFTAHDRDDFMFWVNSWRSVMEMQNDTAFGYLCREAVLHEGPAFIDCGGIRKASYAVVYAGRVEFLEEPAQKFDRTVARRIVWPEDVKRIQVNNDGFTIGFLSGTIEVEISQGQDLGSWSGALTQLLQPPEAAAAAPAAAKEDPPLPGQDVVPSRSASTSRAPLRSLRRSKPSSPSPPPVAIDPNARLLEGNLWISDPMLDAGAAEPSGLWRSAALFQDRVECWNLGKETEKGQAPDLTIQVEDITHADVDTSAEILWLTCKPASGTSGGVRRVHFDTVQELGRWSVAVLGLIQRSPKEAPLVKKKPGGSQNARKHPQDWLPRVATIESKPKGQAQGDVDGRILPNLRSEKRSDRPFVVKLVQESNRHGAQDFRGVRSATKPMSDDVKNSAIRTKANPRRASAPRWPQDKPIAQNINGARVPRARKSFKWAKITEPADGTAVHNAPKREIANNVAPLADAVPCRNASIRRPRGPSDLDKMREISGAKLYHMSFR